MKDSRIKKIKIYRRLKVEFKCLGFKILVDIIFD